MISTPLINIESTLARPCCQCSLRSGLKRLHKITTPHGHEFRYVPKFCADCGWVPEIDGHLDAADLKSSAEIYAKVENARAAVAAKSVTTFDSCDMPHAYDFSDLGLIRPLSPSALFDGYPTSRASLEPLLMAQLGLGATTRKRTLKAANFPGIDVDSAATVGHIFDPDPLTSRPDRIDDNHVLYWPLIPLTLEQPFEIWQQQSPGKSNQKEWVFLACYVLEGEIRYHMVLVNRQRAVRTAYRLNGWRQAHAKRVGIPVYLGY